MLLIEKNTGSKASGSPDLEEPGKFFEPLNQFDEWIKQ